MTQDDAKFEPPRPSAPPGALYAEAPRTLTQDDAKLYPHLDMLEQGTNFRLSEVSNIRKSLQDEASQRARARRRYKVAYTTSFAVNTAVCAVSSLSTAGAVGTLATGVGAVVALPLGIVSLVGGGVGLIGSTVQKILLKKLEKHDRILALAEAKLGTVDRLVNTALNDDHISDSEFEAIQREMAEFRTRKREIQLKIRASSNTDLEHLKKDLMEQGRQQGLEEARQALGKRS